MAGPFVRDDEQEGGGPLGILGAIFQALGQGGHSIAMQNRYGPDWSELQGRQRQLHEMDLESRQAQLDTSHHTLKSSQFRDRLSRIDSVARLLADAYEQDETSPATIDQEVGTEAVPPQDPMSDSMAADFGLSPDETGLARRAGKGKSMSSKRDLAMMSALRQSSGIAQRGQVQSDLETQRQRGRVDLSDRKHGQRRELVNLLESGRLERLLTGQDRIDSRTSAMIGVRNIERLSREEGAALYQKAIDDRSAYRQYDKDQDDLQLEERLSQNETEFFMRQQQLGARSRVLDTGDEPGAPVGGAVRDFMNEAETPGGQRGSRGPSRRANTSPFIPTVTNRAQADGMPEGGLFKFNGSVYRKCAGGYSPGMGPCPGQ